MRRRVVLNEDEKIVPYPRATKIGFLAAALGTLAIFLVIYNLV